MGVSWIKREFTDVGLTQYPVGRELEVLQGRLGGSRESALLEGSAPASSGSARASDAGASAPRPSQNSDPQGHTDATALDSERAALMAYFESTDGPNWHYGHKVDSRSAWSWDSYEPVGMWHGITTNRTGHVTHIILIDVGVRTVHMSKPPGSIPPEFGQLTNLQYLDLRCFGPEGIKLSEPIPPELGQLTNLQHLHVIGDLSGPIPPELGQLTNLQYLDLRDNKLSGPIPPELGQLTNLQYLDLQGSNLSGPIPPELGQLTNLQHLHVIGDLSGPIPPELGQLTNLQYLDLQGSNLSGPIPPELDQLTNLQYLDLQGSNLSGPIPPELDQLTNLQHLHVIGDLSGPIPPELDQLTNLCYLDLGGNSRLRPIPRGVMDRMRDKNQWGSRCFVEGPGVQVGDRDRVESDLRFRQSRLRQWLQNAHSQMLGCGVMQSK